MYLERAVCDKGEKQKTVAKVEDIGHLDVATPLRYYVDVFPEDLEEAAEILAER